MQTGSLRNISGLNDTFLTFAGNLIRLHICFPFSYIDRFPLSKLSIPIKNWKIILGFNYNKIFFMQHGSKIWDNCSQSQFSSSRSIWVQNYEVLLSDHYKKVSSESSLSRLQKYAKIFLLKFRKKVRDKKNFLLSLWTAF